MNPGDDDGERLTHPGRHVQGLGQLALRHPSRQLDLVSPRSVAGEALKELLEPRKRHGGPDLND